MGVTPINLNDALGFLNPEDDNDWTHDGLPLMDVIEKLMDDESITRKDVTEADPEFCRKVAAQRREAKAIAESEANMADEENQDDQSTEMQAGNEKETSGQGQMNPEEALRAEIQKNAQDIEGMLSYRAKLETHIDDLKRCQAQLQHKVQVQHSADADMKARMAFIKAQGEQRAKRYEKGRRILEVIGKDGLNPQCNLDQAMQRKTKQGTRRPPPRAPEQN